MFCHQCGKKLRENARFCSHCGTPVRENTEQSETAVQTADSGVYTGEEHPSTGSSGDYTGEEHPSAGSSGDHTGEEHPSTGSSGTDTEEAIPRTEIAAVGPEGSDSHISCPDMDPKAPREQEIPAIPPTADGEMPVDLILEKSGVVVTGPELYLNRKHYIRKPGRKKFKKKENSSVIPLSSILGTSMEHHKYGGRILLSFLLLLCFAAGAFFSARRGYDTYLEQNTPYREQELAELESILAIIDNDGAGQLLQYQNSQAENRADTAALLAKLDGLKAQQTEEILESVYSSDRFDPDAFFHREPFSHAYREYLQELLDAFKADGALNSWLYSYYETAGDYGGNYFLDTDMWIYSDSGENRFSSSLDSAAGLMEDLYDLDLYEHILFTGRIYVTGADFMQKILALPRYIVDGAVFADAYGGVPDPAAMSVPGWSRSHYEEFWLYGVDYYNVDTPMWLDYGLSAKDFQLDWNTLLDETAYYTAYRNFMDKIDPNLPCYDMAVYHADDTAYGGMGCSIKGSEASFSDMIASYAENHPEFIDELRENDYFGKTLTTSVDEEIAGTEAQLEQLEQEFLDLQDQEEELAQILAEADMHRNDHALLLADMERHGRELTCRLLFFGGTALLCVPAAVICLFKFFDCLKRPRHLFIIRGQDMEYAFRARRCSMLQIAALQSRLRGRENDGKDPFS